MIRNKISILLLFLFFTNGLFLAAQDYETSTFKRTNSILLRGKVLPGFLFEDWYLFNATIGAEVRIAPQQSIGLDYIALWQWHEKDLWDTVKHEELTYGFSQRDFRHFVHLDYRFYFDPKFAQRNGFSLYTSLYGKTGRARMKSETGYLFDEGEEIKNENHFLDAGLGLGIRSGMKEDSDLGFDFNIGACKRYQVYNAELYHEQGAPTIVTDVHSSRWMPWCRLNLYLYLTE